MKNFSDNRVIIVVPVYKKNIADVERVSLTQLNKILGQYPICFVAPESLKEIPYNESNRRVEHFDDKFFRNIPSYSRLLMSEIFYQRFSDYEYMLIYQLDAFVFSDKLKFYLDLGFDYIGAPHPRHGILWGKLGLVGDGGFSLRKVSACLSVVKRVDDIISEHIYEQEMRDAEDLFFAYCGIREDINFTVPSPRVAVRFSISNNSYHAFDFFDKNINFGCHSWYKGDYDFWKKVIESCGYTLPELGDYAKHPTRKNVLVYALFKRLMRRDNLLKTKKALQELLHYKSYIVWGAGLYGKRVVELLCNVGIYVKCIYDKNPAINEYKKISIKKFEDSEVRKNDIKIILASRKYDSEMRAKLLELGKQLNKDFVSFQDIERCLIMNIYGLHL